MSELGEFLRGIYGKISELQTNRQYRKCLSCDCYFTLLYYMKRELSKSEDTKYKGMFKDVSFLFDQRNQVKMHRCLGCDPCPPAEWNSELLKKEFFKGKGVIEVAKDPVCGMEVDEKKAAGKSEHMGKTYYFCAPGCKKVFDENPEKYIKGEMPGHHGHQM